MQLHPSEFSKIAVISGLASLGAHFGSDIDLRRLAVLLAAPGIPLLLIMLQPDPGTAMVFVAITMGVLLVAGVRAKHIAGLTLAGRSEEHTSELQSLMRISYAVFCLNKKKQQNTNGHHNKHT